MNYNFIISANSVISGLGFFLPSCSTATDVFSSENVVVVPVHDNSLVLLLSPSTPLSRIQQCTTDIPRCIDDSLYLIKVINSLLARLIYPFKGALR